MVEQEQREIGTALKMKNFEYRTLVKLVGIEQAIIRSAFNKTLPLALWEN